METTQMTTQKVYEKSEIASKLASSQAWLERGILAIYARQTADEKNHGETVHLNCVGFSGADAKYLSYLARYLQNGNHLSGKFLVGGRKRMAKYAGQLTKIANGE